MNEKIKLISETAEGIANSIANREGFKNLSYEQIFSILKFFYGEEKLFQSKMDSYSCSVKLNIKGNTVRKVKWIIDRVSQHPVRFKKYVYVNEILDSLKDKDSFVSFETLKDNILDDYECFIIMFNIFSMFKSPTKICMQYIVTNDKKGLKKIDFTM